MWSCLDLCEIARIVVNVSECPNDEEHIDRRSMYAQVGRSALWVSWGLITPVVVLVHACRSFVRCSHGPQAATQQGADSIPRVSATHIKGEMKGKHERECCTPCCKHACTCSERGHASVQHYVALCYIVALCWLQAMLCACCPRYEMFLVFVMRCLLFVWCCFGAALH